MSSKSLIKSKKRVKEHGEVFTPEWIVKEMLDMVKTGEVEDINATILEPSIGEGAFFVEILKRRMEKVFLSEKDQQRYENKVLKGITTLYGIELLEDNLRNCKRILFEKFKEIYLKHCEERAWTVDFNVLDSAKVIFEKNVVQGNFLTKVNNEGKEVALIEWMIRDLKSSNPKATLKEYSLSEIERIHSEDSDTFSEDRDLLSILEEAKGDYGRELGEVSLRYLKG